MLGGAFEHEWIALGDERPIRYYDQMGRGSDLCELDDANGGDGDDLVEDRVLTKRRGFPT